MAAIRLMYICESDIDLIEQFSLYLDLCQIIEQDKYINSLNSVNTGFPTYNNNNNIYLKSNIQCTQPIVVTLLSVIAYAYY